VGIELNLDRVFWSAPRSLDFSFRHGELFIVAEVALPSPVSRTPASLAFQRVCESMRPRRNRDELLWL
jgi:hypothetical protein